MFEVVAIDEDGRAAYTIHTYGSGSDQEEKAYHMAKAYKKGNFPRKFSWFENVRGGQDMKTVTMIDVIVRDTGM